MDSSALAPLLLLGKPEPAISLRKKYFFELREAGFLGELETSRSALSGLLGGRVVRHRVIQSGSDAIRLSRRDMLAASGSTPAIHRIEVKGFGNEVVGGSVPLATLNERSCQSTIDLFRQFCARLRRSELEDGTNLAGVRLDCDEQFRTRREASALRQTADAVISNSYCAEACAQAYLTIGLAVLDTDSPLCVLAEKC